MAWHTLPLDEWSKFRELTDADPCLLLQILADAVRPVTLSSWTFGYNTQKPLEALKLSAKTTMWNCRWFICTHCLARQDHCHGVSSVGLFNDQSDPGRRTLTSSSPSSRTLTRYRKVK
jgi:hypothetical protein